MSSICGRVHGQADYGIRDRQNTVGGSVAPARAFAIVLCVDFQDVSVVQDVLSTHHLSIVVLIPQSGILEFFHEVLVDGFSNTISQCQIENEPMCFS